MPKAASPIKTVWLTGANGMVGRNVLAHPNAACYQWLTPTRTELDARNPQAVAHFLAQHRPDMVIHCAGKVGGIAANMAAPVDFLMDNLQLAQAVIAQAHKAGVPRLINLSSSCMYPRNVEGLLEEPMILTGELEPTNEGYALAKIVSLRLCQYLNQQYGAAYKTLIPCNLYGAFDHFDPVASHLIPAVILKTHQAIASGAETIEIWGDGTARREFMAASDLADCLFAALENPEAYASLPEVMNVGLGYDHTVTEYYQAVAELMGFSGGFVYNLEKPVGMRRKVVCVAQAKTWGWQAKRTLQQGLQEALEYFQTHVLAQNTAPCQV